MRALNSSTVLGLLVLCASGCGSSGTNTSLKISVRETVPRMPSGSQSPVTVTPGALAGMPR